MALSSMNKEIILHNILLYNFFVHESESACLTNQISMISRLCFLVVKPLRSGPRIPPSRPQCFIYFFPPIIFSFDEHKVVFSQWLRVLTLPPLLSLVLKEILFTFDYREVAALYGWHSGSCWCMIRLNNTPSFQSRSWIILRYVIYRPYLEKGSVQLID